MVKIFKIELIKAVKSKRLIIFTGIMIILSIFFGAIVMQIEKTGLVTEEMMETMRGGYFSIQILGLTADMVLPIFSTLLVCFLISDEYSAGTLKLPVLCGYSRIKIIVSKTAAVIFMMLLIMTVTWLCSNVVSAFIWGNEEVISMLAFTAQVYFRVFLAMAAWSILMTALSLFIQNSGILIGAMVAVLVVSSILANMFPDVAQYILTYYLKGFIAISNTKEIVMGCIVCFVNAVIFEMTAMLRFFRMEIQK